LKEEYSKRKRKSYFLDLIGFLLACREKTKEGIHDEFPLF
jgi:hypothetical protein